MERVCKNKGQQQQNVQAQAVDENQFKDKHLFMASLCATPIESEEKWSESANTAICRKWWHYMADIMETNSDESPVSVDLLPVFHLD